MEMNTIQPECQSSDIVRKQILDSAEEIFSVMQQRESPENVQRIRDAFIFADEAHKLQRRKSGEPYIIHPVAVALIVAKELELDTNTVIAAFLHDVVEDTDRTIDQIRERFGDDVAYLVDVVTKKKKDPGASSKQVENFKQILESVDYDVRALLLKLSDRLHNMRTLSSLTPAKQMKIAGETDFFYAPLANRLGLYYVKSELENLSFRYRSPKEFARIERQLEMDAERTRGTVELFCSEALELLKAKGLNVRIEVRYRKPYSIWKAMNKSGIDFRHVDFKHYIRIIYTPREGWSEKVVSTYIYSLLTSHFKERPGSVSNYIDSPKDNGYQSFHVKLLNHSGVWEELHISSERMIRHSRLGCIVEREEGGASLWLDRFRVILKDLARYSNEFDFMDGLRSSFYSEDIVVFTPDGKAVTLPSGATAIDFAYEIHSELGEHAKFARINGNLSSVKSELRRGDCVEIGADSSCTPEGSWLDCVKTYKAKRCINSFLKNCHRLGFERCPICNPLPGDEVIGFRIAPDRLLLHSRNCYEAIKMASERGDSIEAVNFEPNPDILYPVSVSITAIDRYHYLRDVIDSITERHHLSIDTLNTETVDNIVHTTLKFAVHSTNEFQEVVSHIAGIEGVDEVQYSQLPSEG